jgi:hypothetical protein
MHRLRCPLRLVGVSLALAVGGLYGCGKSAPEVVIQPVPSAGRPATSTEPRTSLISEKDCDEYARSVTSAVSSGNKPALNALFDWDAIFATATANLGGSPESVADWTKELKQSLERDTSFTDSIIRSTKTGGRFDFLRARISRGRQVIVFRLLGKENEGVNYMEFVAKRGADSKIRASDIYTYGSGELISETLHRILLPAAASESRSFLEKLVKKEQDFVLDLPKIKPITEAIGQGKPKEALRMIDQLRPETKKTKIVLLMRTQAAQGVDEKAYLAALEDFRSLFPNDPCLDLQLVDYYAMTNNHDEALKCIDRLDKSVGGDPYLNYIRASNAVDRGDRAGARRFAKLVVEQEPSFEDAYAFLLGLSIQDKQHDEALIWLKKLHEEFKMPFGDLTKVDQYTDFVKSPQHKEWLKYLEEEAKEKKATQKPKQDGQAEQVPKQPGSQEQ